MVNRHNELRTLNFEPSKINTERKLFHYSRIVDQNPQLELLFCGSQHLAYQP